MALLRDSVEVQRLATWVREHEGNDIRPAVGTRCRDVENLALLQPSTRLGISHQALDAPHTAPVVDCTRVLFHTSSLRSLEPLLPARSDQ